MQESKGSALGYLDYWGMLTDGGLDDNSPFYWVDNMFSSRADHYYCSQMFKSSDIRCIAVQNPIPSRPRRGECIKAVKAIVNTNSVRSEKHRLRPDWELNSLSNGATGVASDLPSNHELLVDEESLGLMRKQSHIAMQEIVVNRGVRKDLRKNFRIISLVESAANPRPCRGFAHLIYSIHLDKFCF